MPVDLTFDLDADCAAEAAVARWWRRRRKRGVRRLARIEHGQGAWHTWTLRVPVDQVSALLALLAEHDITPHR